MNDAEKLIYNLKYYPGQPRHEEKLLKYINSLTAENERLKIDKRELVKVLESVKKIFWYQEAVVIIDAAIAKHKGEE